MLNILEADLVMDEVGIGLLIVKYVRHPPEMYRLFVLQTFPQFNGRTYPFAVRDEHMAAFFIHALHINHQCLQCHA